MADALDTSDAVEAGESSSLNNKPSAIDHQRKQLDKLLANPDKPVYIPKIQAEKNLRPPREIMKVSIVRVTIE